MHNVPGEVSNPTSRPVPNQERKKINTKSLKQRGGASAKKRIHRELKGRARNWCILLGGKGGEVSERKKTLIFLAGNKVYLKGKGPSFPSRRQSAGIASNSYDRRQPESERRSAQRNACAK